MKKLYIKDDFSEVWVHSKHTGGYIFEDQYEIIEELDFYCREYSKQAAIEEAKRKTLKLASMK